MDKGLSDFYADLAIDIRAQIAFHKIVPKAYFPAIEDIMHTNPVFFQLIDPEDDNTLPEDNQPVLWYCEGEPPYSGTMVDEDFPGLEYFKFWCAIPQPPSAITENVF